VKRASNQPLEIKIANVIPDWKMLAIAYPSRDSWDSGQKTLPVAKKHREWRSLEVKENLLCASL
jgi:hypothetical protein